MAVADVNWLLSALAQATAAMIAIVGGLLVSRYVTLHAEQQGARRRVEDLLRREREAQEALAAARTDLDAYYVEDVLDDDRVFEEIFNSELEPNVDEVLQALEEEDGNLNRDLLTQEVEAMAHDMAAAIDAIYELVPASESHDDWLAFRRKHSIEIGHRNLWEWVYDKVCEERRGEAKAVAREAMKNSPYGRSFALTQQQDYSLLTAGFTPPAISAASRMIRSQREMAQVDALQSRIGEAEAELRALAQERRLAEETYDATRQPEGFVLALQVLTFLAVVGMGVPVILMGFATMTLPAWARVAVISLFIVGVAMLLRFLFVYAGFLREGGRETLPRSLLGLLWRAPRVATSGT